MSAGGVNKAILMGRVTHGPEIRTTKAVPQAVFGLETSEIWFDKETNEKREKTIGHRIVVYGPRSGQLTILDYVNGERAAQTEAPADGDLGDASTPLSIKRSSARYGDGLDAAPDQEPGKIDQSLPWLAADDDHDRARRRAAADNDRRAG